MDPVTIVLIVLAVAGIWAVVEIALVARRARTTMDTLDKAVEHMNDTLDEARPVISKLDCTIDDLQPAIQRVEPLLESATVAVDALSADLVEVEAVVRDVAHVTGSAARASSAFTGVADTASEAVQRLINRKKPAPQDPERTLESGAEPREAARSDDAAAPSQPTRYYTYDASASADDRKEADHA